MEKQLNNEEIRKVLAKNVRIKRLSSDLKQSTLAELSNVSEDFISNIERGNSGISLLNLVNICNALNTTANDLLGEFFSNSIDESSDILQKLNLLDEHEKNAILTLIDYYLNAKKHK